MLMRLEISYREKKNYNNAQTHGSLTVILNNQSITEEIKKCYGNDSKTTTQSPWDAAKAVLREKFIAIQS